MAEAMIVPLSNANDKQDLVYLDFQGNFDGGGSDLRGATIGDLELKENGAVLVVGHQRLEGKKAKLAKPVAVIHRRNSTEAVYDVVTILREKYVFASRPSVIVKESLRGLTKIGG